MSYKQTTQQTEAQRKNKTASEVQKIRKILDRTSKEDLEAGNYAHFTVGEKCDAIKNWANANNTNFNLNFVNSVEDYFSNRGMATAAQESAINKIISKWKIDIDKWCM